MKVCVNKDVLFEYVTAPPLNHKLLLLTKGGVLVLGPWKGAPLGENKTYMAWAPLPGRNREMERALEYI